MRNYIYLFLFYFANLFFIKTESHINIIDDDVAKYFDSNWVNNIKNKRHTILVKMNKVKTGDDVESNDYESTYECKKEFKHNGQNYRIFIDVEKGHKLKYIIWKKGENDLYYDITDENDEKIFYFCNGVNEETKKKIYDKSPESTLKSYNWVLAKIKPKDKDEYFYVFINNIDEVIENRTIYCCLGHWNQIKDFNFIYSQIIGISNLSATLPNFHTQLVNIDFTGLNFNVDGNYKLSKWFENAADLKKIENFPKIDNEIDIEGMLKGCKNLEDVDLGNNTINNAPLCFLKCENLKNVNLEGTSITENANLSNMFNLCKKLENLKGIETLVKENDKPDLNCMFTDCNIKGDLDLSQWGTNIKSYKYLFYKSNLKNLTLFNLKELIKKNKETIENNKKKIDEIYKKYPDKSLNSKIKSLALLEKRYLNLNAEENKRFNDLLNDNEINKVTDLENYKKEMEDVINIEIENNLLESPDIIKDSTIENLNIKEEFMPDNKQDLNKILGSEYNITGDINIIKSNGEIVKYKNFDDYPYKEQEEPPTNPINPQIPEDIKEKEIPKPNSCLNCCAKCFSKCCCCCKRNV